MVKYNLDKIFVQIGARAQPFGVMRNSWWRYQGTPNSKKAATKLPTNSSTRPSQRPCVQASKMSGSAAIRRFDHVRRTGIVAIEDVADAHRSRSRGLGSSIEINTNQVAPFFSVELRGHTDRIQQIAEHHRDMPALVEQTAIEVATRPLEIGNWRPDRIAPPCCCFA